MSDAALKSLITDLIDDANDVIRRLDEVIGELPRPTEEESIARIAKQTFKQGARWLKTLGARLAKQPNGGT